MNNTLEVLHLNRGKLKQYKPSVISMHDSWISFVCLAVNGFFYSDQNAYIMYRQHDANVLGAQRHSLKDTLMEANELAVGKDHQFKGRYEAEKNAVIISLEKDEREW